MAKMNAMVEMLVNEYNPRLTGGAQNEVIHSRAQAKRQTATTEPLAIEVGMPEDVGEVPLASDDLAVHGALIALEVRHETGDQADTEVTEDPKTRPLDLD